MKFRPTLRRKVLRDMRKHWPQFVTLAVIITLGVAVFTASFGAYRNLVGSYASLFDSERFPTLWVSGGDVAGFVADVNRDPTVEVADARTQADLSISVGESKLRGRIVGIPERAVGGVTLLSGRQPARDGEVLVESHMADHFHLHDGDVVSVLGPHGWQQVSVTGVVSSAEYLWPSRDRQDMFPLANNFGVLFAPNVFASQFSDTGDNQALVRMHDGHGDAALDRLRDEAFQHGAIEVIDRARQPSNSLLTMDLNSFRWLAYMFPLLFLTVAALMTYVLLSRHVRSERSVIAVLTAGGFPRRAVIWHYLQFGLLAGAFGAAVGVVVGAGGSILLTHLYARVISLPETITRAHVDPAVIAVGVAFGVCVGLISAAAPALLAVRTSPAAAMSSAVPVERGRPSITERLIPPLRRLPVRWLLVLRNIERNRWRTSCTMIGTVLSLVLILASWTLIDSMTGAFRTQFDAVQLADARVSFVHPADQNQLEQLSALPGVTQVEPSIDMPVTLSAGGRTYTTTMFGMRGDTTMHGFHLTDGTPTRLSGDGVLIGRGIHDELGVGAGDIVTLAMPGARPVTVAVVGLLNEPIGTYAYAPISWIEGIEGHPISATSALLRLQDGADPDLARQAAMQLPDVAYYEQISELERVIDRYAALFFAFVGAMLVFGALLAFAIIFTTMSVNIVERRREVAVLRSGGMAHATVARLITAENMLVTLLGVLPGLVAGVLVAQAFMRAYTNDQFRLDLVVNPLTLIASAAAVMLAAVVSQWPGLRAVRNLDLATVVRERTG